MMRSSPSPLPLPRSPAPSLPPKYAHSTVTAPVTHIPSRMARRARVPTPSTPGPAESLSTRPRNHARVSCGGTPRGSAPHKALALARMSSSSSGGPRALCAPFRPLRPARGYLARRSSPQLLGSRLMTTRKQGVLSGLPCRAL